MDTPITAEDIEPGTNSGAAALRHTADEQPPWSPGELEHLAADEDRRVAEAQVRQDRGLQPYSDLISTEDLRERIDEMQNAATSAP